MFKKLFASLLAAGIMASCMVVSANIIKFDTENLFDDDLPEKYYEAYTLSNNTAYNGSREGIHAGWTYDNRAGNLRINVTAGYGTVVDTSLTESSVLYRDLNKVDEGTVAVETAITYVSGFDGLNLFMNDEDGNTVYSLITENGSYAVLGKNGEYTPFYTPAQMGQYVNIKLFIDFDTKNVRTVLDDASVIDTELLSDNIMRFGYGTSKEDTLTIQPDTLKMTANYVLDEEFKYNTSSKSVVPYGWNSEDKTFAYIAHGTGYVFGGRAMSKQFRKTGGKIAFESQLYVKENTTGAISLTNDGDDALVFAFDGKNFRLNGTEVYENTDYLENFWYRFRIEADFDKHTAIIYMNGRKTGEISLPESLEYVDGIKFTATGNGIEFDNVLVHSLVEKDDYVPVPVKPNDSENHIVGMNICSLWSYESTHGWLTISPYDDFRPILGYYDEGSPECADWEIKMMVEHGIDFQAFCWYADKSNAPLRYPSNMLQLNEGYMYAKYSDMMNYCLIWEAANGRHPAGSEAFRQYFVPYWIEHYFKDDRYLVIDNKPVLLCFGFTSFIGDVGGAENAKADLDYLRDELKKIGFDGLIFISSHSGDSETMRVAGADGVCAYNWGTSGNNLEYSIGRIEACANIGKTWTVPTLSTGFNSLPWHGKRYGNMLPSDFEKGLTYMRDEYFEKYPIKESWQDKLYMLSTWNEYGEGTYIMPCEELYGFGYLEAVRNVFTDRDNTSHKDIIPTDEQLSRINKNYPQHIRVLRRNDTYTPDLEKSLSAVATVNFSGKELFKTGGCTITSYNGSIKGKTTSKLAYVETADELNMRISDVVSIKIEMSVSEESQVAIWYTTDYSPYLTADKTLTFTATPDKSVYILNFTKSDTVLRSIRVMPATKENVTFEIKSVSLLNPKRLYIDDKKITSLVYPDTIGDNTYYPFDPREAQGYIMNCHYEWDYKTKKLSIYGTDDRFIQYTVGSKYALTHDGEITLPVAVYQSDNLPMLHMESFCDAFGFDYDVKPDGFHLKTDNYKKHSYIFSHPENEWDFSMGTQLGWTADNAVMYITDDNELYIKANDGDTRTRVSDINIVAEKYSHAEICLKYKTVGAGHIMGIFFITDTDGTWDELKHSYVKYLSADSGDEYVTYRIPLTDYVNAKGEKPWKGIIKSIRFDPFNSAGSQCWIKYIKLIPNPDYNDGSVKKEEFKEVFFDAENGKMPFYAGGKLEVVKDPLDETNSVYMVAPAEGKEMGGYIGVNFDMYFEPGATYSVEYDLLGGKAGADNYELKANTAMYVDARYVDPAQEGKNNPHDHFNGHDITIQSNADAWKHHSVKFTVNSDSFDRTQDEFRIYANPVEGKSLTYYIDNLKITKISTSGIKDVSVKRSLFIGFTVKGSADVLLESDKCVFVAMYDKNGRLYDMEQLPLNENKEFSLSYTDWGKVKTVKIFTWKGLRTFEPYDEALVYDIGI